MKKLSVYVHIPFCVKKCDYCDFLSAPADENTKTEYVDRLLEEIEKEAENYRDYMVVSVFFGGGTPSVLKKEDTARIMSALREHYKIAETAEITSEVNPKTADDNKLKAYREMGFNRLSIGLQSADDKELKTLGRVHNYSDFLEVYKAARKAGFQNINIDIMSALPGQTPESYRKTVERVLKLQPEHISAYSLIIEEGTPFYSRYGEEDELRKKSGKSCIEENGKQGSEMLHLPDEEEEREMYMLTGELLENYGYHRYEISNYAKDNYECRHNKAYWERQDYVGFGIGAASLVQNVRFQNKRDIKGYLSGDFEKEEVDTLTEKESMEEFMFLGLRLMCGVSKEQFLMQFGIPMEQVYDDVLNKMEKQGLLVNGNERVCLTGKGLDISNYVMAQFLLDGEMAVG